MFIYKFFLNNLLYIKNAFNESFYINNGFLEYAIIYAEVAMFVFFCTSVDRRLYIYNSTKHYGVCEK